MNEKKKNPVTTMVAKINNSEIVIVENGSKLVPIKPICQALGIDEDAQRRKLKDDPILASTTVLSTAVAADGKSREMVSIPLMWVFGWLLTIDARNVKEEAREALIKYQVECYKALYNHFTRHAEFVEWRNAMIEEQLMIVDEKKRSFSVSKKELSEANEELNRRRQMTENDYYAIKAQLTIPFVEE